MLFSDFKYRLGTPTSAMQRAEFNQLLKQEFGEPIVKGGVRHPEMFEKHFITSRYSFHNGNGLYFVCQKRKIMYVCFLHIEDYIICKLKFNWKDKS